MPWNFAFKKKKLIQGVDIATAKRGYSDGQAWIQRRLGVDPVTVCCGTFPSLTVASIASLSLYLGFAVSIATSSCHYRESLDI